MKELDPILHNALRLKIMALLAQEDYVTFNVLLEKTKATRGNLSVQISNLQQENYLEVEKLFVDNKPQTRCGITEKGKAAMLAYTQALKDYLNL